MKITVKTYKQLELEVDDKFNSLALDDKDYIGYPENQPLMEELAQEIEKQIGIKQAWQYENGIPLNEEICTDIERTSDHSSIAEW